MKRIWLQLTGTILVTIAAYSLFIWFDSKIPLITIIQLKGNGHAIILATADYGYGYDEKNSIKQKYTNLGRFQTLSFYFPLRNLRKIRNKFKFTILSQNRNKGTFLIESIKFITIGDIEYRWEGQKAFSILKPQNGVSVEVDRQLLHFEGQSAKPVFELSYGAGDIVKRLADAYSVYYVIFSLFIGILFLMFSLRLFQWRQNKSVFRRLLPTVTTMEVGVILFTLILSFVLLGSYVYYRNEMAVADELLTITPRVKNIFEGKFSIVADIWDQQNEHRSAVPIALILLLAPVTNWNLNFELAIGIFLFCIVAIVLWSKSRSLFVNSGLHFSVALYPIIALLVYSLTQYRTFDMGFLSMQYGFCYLSVVVGIFLLSHRDMTPWSYSLAVCCGLIATFSFGTGLAFWASGLFVILIRAYKESKDRLPASIMWIVITLMVAFLYRWGLDYNQSINYAALLEDPIGFIKFSIVFFGTPMCNFSRVGAYVASGLWAGAMVLLMGVWYGTGQGARRLLHKFAPFLALGCYSVVNATLIGIGRFSFLGVDQALWREYKTIATPLWIGLFVFFFFLFETIRSHKPPIRRRINTMLNGATLIVVTLLTVFIFSNFVGLKMMENLHLKRVRQIENLLSINDLQKDEILLINELVGFASPKDLRTKLLFLKENKLTVFRDRK